jgi:hypothetical protein
MGDGTGVYRKRCQVAVIDAKGEVLANRNVPNAVEPILQVIGGLPTAFEDEPTDRGWGGQGSGHGRRSPGRRGEDGRSSLQNLDVFAELAVFAAQLRQLLPVHAGQLAVIAGPASGPARLARARAGVWSGSTSFAT